MDYLNPRGKPFTGEDVSKLLRGLSKISIDPQHFQGEEHEIACGIELMQKRVEESISLYEMRHGAPLSFQKKDLLRQTLMAKLLGGGNRAEDSTTSQFLKRSQKTFQERLQLSRKRQSPKRGQDE